MRYCLFWALGTYVGFRFICLFACEDILSVVVHELNCLVMVWVCQYQSRVLIFTIVIHFWVVIDCLLMVQIYWNIYYDRPIMWGKLCLQFWLDPKTTLISTHNYIRINNIIVPNTMAAEMTIREHVEDLRTRILHIVIAVSILTAFSLIFSFRPIELRFFSIVLYYPYPDIFHNFAIQITSFMQSTLLPPGVKLIQTAPGQAFFAQLYVSMLIGIISSMPIVIKEIYGFIAPAFERPRKARMISVFLPAISLFITGIVFSYVAVFPLRLLFFTSMVRQSALKHSLISTISFLSYFNSFWVLGLLLNYLL